MGVPWVREGIINDFTYFLRTGNEAFVGTNDSTRKYVSYEPLTRYWHVEDKQCTHRSADKTRVRSTYGLPDYNALYILEAALNLREIRRDTEEETVAALEKQEAIERLFKEWVWQDEDRRWEIEEAYCQRRFEIVRKRRRNFVVFRRRGGNKTKRFLVQKECSRFAVSGA